MNQTNAPHSADTDHHYFWFRILIIQSLLMTAYVMPMYGFNALIKPINEILDPKHVLNGWPGALAGASVFMGTGFSFSLEWLTRKWSARAVRRWLIANAILSLAVIVAAVACWRGSLWLLLVASFIAGIATGRCFTHSTQVILSWGRTMGRLGLQSGVFGLMFGLWAAAYSFVAPMAIERWGLEWALIGTAVLVLLVSWIAVVKLRDPPASIQAATTDKPAMPLGQLVGSKPYWVMSIFLLIFLTPGFGFKIIVQSLAQHAYHVTTMTASLVAVAFLVSYGVSRLICGLVADHFRLKPMFLLFTGGQALLLLTAAIGLPHFKEIGFLAVMMCLVGSLFAAGKSLWGMLTIVLFGHANLNVGIKATLFAFALAGVVGPLTLNWALRSTDVIVATSWWMYAMSAAMTIAVVLVWALRPFDFEAYDQHRGQSLHFKPGSRDALDRF
ncbi:MAG: hypothetical protein P8M22_05685 [Phycisphaerales bacterium]|nr:hypothetical protein [Phycisphaerales bacterium]